MTSRTVTYEFVQKGSLTAAFQQTTKDVNATGQAMGTLSQRISATVSDQDRLKVSVRETGNEYTRMRDAANAAAAQARAAAAETRAAQAGSSGGGLGGLIAGGIGAAAGFAAVEVLGALTGGVKDLAGQSLALAGNLEMMRGAFGTFLGSAQAADAQLAQLRAFSDKAPLFDTENTQKFALQLLGAGEQAQRLLPDLKALGAVVAGSGGGTEQLKEAALAYQQVLTNGKLQGQDALQFSNALVPIWKIIAEGLGVSTAKARELSAAGEITAQQFQQAFSEYAVTHFADSLSKAGDTMQGITAQINSGWQNSLTAFGTGLEAGVKPILQEVANILQDPRTLATIEQWGIAAGQFVGILFEGAKTVASWIGLKLPELPQAPNYSDLKLTTADVATNTQKGAAAATDYKAAIAGLRDETAGLRDAQAAYDAGADNRLAKLRDQARLLDQAYQSEKQRKDLARLGSDIKSDELLARDLFSSEGEAARNRLKDEYRKRDDLTAEMAQTGAKNRLANQEAAVNNEKRLTDQGYQAKERALEAHIRRLEALQKEATAGAGGGAATVPAALRTAADGLADYLKTLNQDQLDAYRLAQAAAARTQADTGIATGLLQTLQTWLQTVAGPEGFGLLIGAVDTARQSWALLSDGLSKAPEILTSVGKNLGDLAVAFGLDKGVAGAMFTAKWTFLNFTAAMQAATPPLLTFVGGGLRLLSDLFTVFTKTVLLAKDAVTGMLSGNLDTGAIAQQVLDLANANTAAVNNINAWSSSLGTQSATAYGGFSAQTRANMQKERTELANIGAGQTPTGNARTGGSFGPDQGTTPGYGVRPANVGTGGDTYHITVNGVIGNEAQVAQRMSEILAVHSRARSGGLR